MLEDREYMRRPSGGPHGSATVTLLVANFLVFLLELTVLPALIPEPYLVLSLAGMRHGFVWQLLTYQFLHASWMHLIFNSIALFFFGRPVESVLGKSRFVQLYFASGIMGGVFQMLFALLLPQFFDSPVVGASASVYGVVAAFAVMSWGSRFTLLIYFFPVTMRGRTLLWITIGMALIGLVTPGSGVAHAAHLGGLLTGFFSASWLYGYRRGY